MEPINCVSGDRCVVAAKGLKDNGVNSVLDIGVLPKVTVAYWMTSCLLLFQRLSNLSTCCAVRLPCKKSKRRQWKPSRRMDVACFQH